MAKKSMSMDDSMTEDDESMIDMKTKKHMKSMSQGQPECGDMGMMNQHMCDVMSSEKMPMNSKKKGKSK